MLDDGFELAVSSSDDELAQNISFCFGLFRKKLFFSFFFVDFIIFFIACCRIYFKIHLKGPYCDFAVHQWPEGVEVVMVYMVA